MLFFTIYLDSSPTSCESDLGWKLVFRPTHLPTYPPRSLGERQGVGGAVVGGSAF